MNKFFKNNLNSILLVAVITLLVTNIYKINESRRLNIKLQKYMVIRKKECNLINEFNRDVDLFSMKVDSFALKVEVFKKARNK